VVSRLTYLLACAATTLLVAAAPSAFAGAGVPLATYRAVDDLVLDPNTDSSDIGTMTGRVVTEFKGSECAGYTTTTRFVTEAVDADDQRQVIDSRSLTVEKPDGSLDFDNQTLDNGTASDTSKGFAVRSAEGVQVKLKEPSRKTVNLAPDVVFPTEQVVRTIEAGRAGEHFLSFTTYDGLDDGETAAPATIVIGEGSTDPSDVGDEAPIADAGFATLMHWPVTITYFDEAAGIDQAPNYTMSGILYDNGIMRRLKLDYGRFALVGRLVRLDILPPTPCP
jgi:EipB-like